MDKKILVINTLLSVIMVGFLLVDYFMYQHTFFLASELTRSYYGLDMTISHFIYASIPSLFALTIAFDKHINRKLLIVLASVFTIVFICVAITLIYESVKVFQLISLFDFRLIMVLLIIPLIYLTSCMTSILFLKSFNFKIMKSKVSM